MIKCTKIITINSIKYISIEPKNKPILFPPTLFFSEAKCRLLQNIAYVVCCKQFLGATPPTPCKSNGCGKLRPTFTPSVASAITYKCGLQLSTFYFCNKHSDTHYTSFIYYHSC